MIGTDIFFRVYWKNYNGELQDSEFIEEDEYFDFKDKMVSEGIKILGVEKVEIHFNEDGRVGECTRHYDFPKERNDFGFDSNSVANYTDRWLKFKKRRS